MSLPETLNWCDTHQAGHIGTCDYPNVAVRVAGRDDLVIRREDIIEFTLTDNGIGVEDKDQVVVGCCYDEGPYWNLEAGRYLLIPLAAAEGGET